MSGQDCRSRRSLSFKRGDGITVLIAGLILVRGRASRAARFGQHGRLILVLGPVFEACALAMFAAEHFTAARDLMPIVPRWLPAPLFWTYFVGAALLAAAISFIAWRCSALVGIAARRCCS